MNISEFGVKELKTHELLIDGGGRIARLAGIIVGHLHNAVDWCAENLSSNTSTAYLTEL
jgi:hypothetical protein